MNRQARLVLSGLIFGLISAFIYSLAFAENVPTSARAGQVEKSLKQQEEISQKKPGEAPITGFAQPEQELAVPEGQKILVKDFKFKGNTLLKSAYLKKLIRKYTGKEVTLKQLKDACNIITNEYRKRGFFLAKAYLPQQEIKNGVVTIEIIEGRLGKVIIEGSKYYKKKFIASHFRPDYKNVIHYGRLLKSLLLLNEYPDLQVKAVFQRGEKPYTADIVLEVTDKRPMMAQLDYNNFGSRYISRDRAGAAVEYGNLLFGGDKMYFRGVSGSPLRVMGFAQGEYSLPVNDFGTRAKFGYLWSRFDVQREWRALDAGGLSQIWSFDLEHPLVRTLTSNLDLQFGFDYKSIKNFMLSQTTSDDEERVFSLGLSGDHVDTFSGRNFYSGVGSFGVPDIMGGMKKNDPRASRVGAGGEFQKFNLDLGRVQKFIGDTQIMIKGSGQVASDTLPVPEAFSIGGEDSVRGYPISEYLGDQGYQGTFEFRFFTPFISDWKLPFTRRTLKNLVQWVGFYDYGSVFRKHALVGESKHDDIAGAGIGARLNLWKDFDFRVDLGWPVGSKTPSDGDATHLYMQGIMKF